MIFKISLAEIFRTFGWPRGRRSNYPSRLLPRKRIQKKRIKVGFNSFFLLRVTTLAHVAQGFRCTLLCHFPDSQKWKQGWIRRKKKKKWSKIFRDSSARSRLFPFLEARWAIYFLFWRVYEVDAPWCVCVGYLILNLEVCVRVESRHLWWESHEIYPKNRSNLRVDLVKNDRNLHPWNHTIMIFGFQYVSKSFWGVFRINSWSNSGEI